MQQFCCPFCECPEFIGVGYPDKEEKELRCSKCHAVLGKVYVVTVPLADKEIN